MIIISKTFILDMLIACFVFSLPFLFYLYQYVPHVEVWETSFFSITSHHYDDVNYLLWIFANKAIVFIGCLIWYFTNRLWWRNFVLIPMLVVLIQILSLFDNSKTQFDEVEFLNFIPITLVFIAFIYWFDSRLKYYSLTQNLEQDLNSEIERELSKMKKEKMISVLHLQGKLIDLKMKKESMKHSEYLFKLFELKKSIIDA